MNYLSLIISALLTISSNSNPSLRCFVTSAPDAIKSADSIFVGKVVHVSDPEMPTEVNASTVINLERPITAHLTVEQIYRGKKVKEVDVATMTGSLEWGVNFKEGER